MVATGAGTKFLDIQVPSKITTSANQLFRWMLLPFRATQKFMSQRLESITENYDEVTRFEDGSLIEEVGPSKVPQFYAFMLDNDEDAIVSIIVATTGIAFGAIHCAAWSFEFMSTTDLFIWRISSLVTTVISFLFLVLILALDGVLKPLSMHLKEGVRGFIRINVAPVLFRTLFPLYTLARLALLAEVLMGLGHLPQSAQDVISWTEAIPHL